MKLLETQNLAIGYGARVVASGISLDLGASEVLCLLGPNGAGKTTLFKTLLGLLPPLGGTIRLEGREVASLTRREIARHIAYVPQALGTDLAYSALDLVLMGRTAHLGPFDSPSQHDRERAYGALETLGLADLAGADTSRISGGQRQLVMIARALAQDARIIVMDEPTASLDLGNRVLVLDQINRLVAKKLAIILSTHDPDQALDIADKVAIVSQGRLLAYGATNAAMSEETLSAAYGVGVGFARTDAGTRVVRVERTHMRRASIE